MKLHILGVCGTFMSGIAVLAKQAGHEVTGSDLNVYPPMSTQLEQQGIQLFNGYDAKNIASDCDMVIVGNVIKRGNPAMEYVLNNKIPFLSGPEWLSKNILASRKVLAVAGTHGKTTTTSLLTWILEYAKLHPSFLIGGVPENFGVSARLSTQSPFFVIEADEYDSAFFDKRPKFMHYSPSLAILNNLEFDHADIFSSLDDIKLQFHYLVRTIPGNGRIVRHANDQNLTDVLEKGCWSEVVTFGENGAWQAKLNKADGSQFTVLHDGKEVGEAKWQLLGQHNVENALAAIAAADYAGVPPKTAIEALASFKNVKRRMEVKGEAHGIVVYDDFAHHPTAIATTLAGLRAKIGNARMIAVLEFGSYTMRSGVHKENIREALDKADMVVCRKTDTDWGLKEVLSTFKQPTSLYDDVDSLVSGLAPQLKTGDHVIIMSNSGFGGVHQKLIDAIARK